MTTRAPGLTAAMRRALIELRDKGNVTNVRLLIEAIDAGFVVSNSGLTPRGQAALAAPRMTAAELQMTEWSDAGKRIPTALMLTRAYESLWSKGWLEPDEATGGRLTPAGLTALNNMRAAMGSAEYREDLK